MINRRTRFLRWAFFSLLALFSLLNFIAYHHSYHFTHFDPTITTKTKDPHHLTFRDKVKTLFLGISNPRPQNNTYPSHPYETFQLKSNKTIECWSIKTEKAKGTVILFHGYSGNKSSLLDKAEIFLSLGYNTLLVDFMGSGGSEGNQTTVGFFEAEEVKTAFDYLTTTGEQNILLFGTSMGAVAIMKAINDHSLKPAAILIECPFGSMQKTTEARFKSMGIPSFPMANLLVFWGGFQNNFDAFSHNPIDYSKNISCPTLLLYGEKDEKVSISEIKEIFQNLKGKKQLKIYSLAGHENYLHKYHKEWTKDVIGFIEATKY